LQGVKRGALPNHATLKQTYDEAFDYARQLLKNKET
jgi:hypothetical protein